MDILGVFVPIEILEKIFSYIQIAKDLIAAEGTCKRWNALCANTSIWRNLAIRNFAHLKQLLEYHDGSTNWKNAFKDLHFHKYFHRTSNYVHNLQRVLKNSVRASSVDYDTQDIQNSLKGKLYSSTGSFDPNSQEYLIYELQDEFNLVLSVQYGIYTYPRPYISREIIVCVGQDKAKDFHYASIPYSLTATREKVTILVQPLVAIGKYLKVMMLGRHQIDVGNSYMTNLYWINVHGVSFPEFNNALKEQEKKILLELIKNADIRLASLVQSYMLHLDKKRLSKEIVSLVKGDARTASTPQNMDMYHVRTGTYVGEPLETDRDGEVFDGSLSPLFKQLVKQRIHFVFSADIKLFSSSSFASSIKNLQVINFSSNSTLATLPEELFSLKGLQILNLVDCKLCELSDSIGNLTNLRRLNLCGNKLKKLPDTIGNLTLLEELFIGEGSGHHKREYENTIAHLPDSIGNLVNLKRLWIQRLGLKDLPSTLANLKNVKQILLRENDRDIEVIAQKMGFSSSMFGSR